MTRKDLKTLQLQPLNEGISASALPNYAAGMPPFLRGPHASMYIHKPWAIRQQPQFKSIAEANRYFTQLTERQKKKAFIALNLQQHTAADSLTNNSDLQALFSGLSLEQFRVLWSSNYCPATLLACHLGLVEERQANFEMTSISVQTNILSQLQSPKNFAVQSAIFWHTVFTRFSNFKGITLSAIPLASQATPEIEIALTIASGIAYLDAGIQLGYKIDSLAAQIDFAWEIKYQISESVAKLQAARFLWAKVIKTYQPKHQHSMAMRSHGETLHSLTNQPILAQKEALAAVLSGVQSLTVVSDNAQLAWKTQLVLQKELGLTAPIDPFGGSQLIAERTHQLIAKADAFIQHIQNRGGLFSASALTYCSEELEISIDLSNLPSSKPFSEEHLEKSFEQAISAFKAGKSFAEIEEILN